MIQTLTEKVETLRNLHEEDYRVNKAIHEFVDRVGYDKIMSMPVKPIYYSTLKKRQIDISTQIQAQNALADILTDGRGVDWRKRL